ncbi:MAG TPA: hypothetical protein VNT42_03395 [Sphingomonas sp.]|nr:hypothetical protein [Sphingomonas sp.]
MARFYLNIHNGSGFVEDLEGLELSDLEAARCQAIDGVRSLVSEEARQGRIDLTGSIEIVDDDGRVLLNIAFADAVEVRLGEQSA